MNGFLADFKAPKGWSVKEFLYEAEETWFGINLYVAHKNHPPVVYDGLIEGWRELTCGNGN